MPASVKPMSLPMRLTLWFVVANAYLAAVSLIAWPVDTDRTFFWRITPPINAGMYGVLYLVAGTAALRAALRGRWEPARYLTAMLPAFTGLALLATLLHRDRLAPGARLSYWLAVYTAIPLAVIAFHLQHERGRANWQIVGRPLAPVARAIAGVAGALALAFAAIGYAFPSLITPIWPWAISPLMARIFLSWVAALGIGLLWLWRERDWDRVRPMADTLIAASALLLLQLVMHRGDLKPATIGPWLFAAGVVGVGLLGAYLHLEHRRGPAGEPRPGRASGARGAHGFGWEGCGATSGSSGIR